jgi:hypothetical protein
MLRVHIIKEHDMGTTKLLVAAAAILMIGGLSGCASTEQSGIAARHQHLRDAKQGPAASTLARAEEAAPKLLHDHREMK